MTRRALFLTLMGSAGAATTAAASKASPTLEARVGALEQAMNVVWLTVGLDRDEGEHPDFGKWFDSKDAWLEMKRAQEKK